MNTLFIEQNGKINSRAIVTKDIFNECVAFYLVYYQMASTNFRILLAFSIKKCKYRLKRDHSFEKRARVRSH